MKRIYIYIPRLGRLFFTSCWYDEESQRGFDKFFCRSIKHNERKFVNCSNGARDFSLGKEKTRIKESPNSTS